MASKNLLPVVALCARSQPERLSPLGRLPSWQAPYQQP